MKQQLTAFRQSFWTYLNSNITGAVIVAGVTYVLTEGAQSTEIKELKNSLFQANARETELRDNLIKSTLNHNNVLHSLVSANHNLQTSEKNLMLTRYAYDNSGWFFKQKIPSKNQVLTPDAKIQPTKI